MPRDTRQRNSLVMPILLIALGALFLFRSYHPGFEPYRVLKTYWPLILILVGLGKIWDSSRRRSDSPDQPSTGVALGSTLGVVAFVLVIVILLGHYQKSSHHGEPLSSEPSGHVSQIIEPHDLQGAKSLSAEFKMGSGELNVAGGSAHLLNADFYFSRRRDTPSVDYHLAGEKGIIEISQDRDNITLGSSDNTWNVNFSDELPLDLRVEMGAGKGNLRLPGLKLTSLDLNMGAGQVIFDLTGPRTSNVNVSIKGGVGQATIRLPKDVGVRAYASGGIGSIRTEGLHQDGKEYTNDALGKSPHTIQLDVQGGIGDIELLQEP